MEMRMMSSIDEKKRYQSEETTEPDAHNKIVKKIAWYTHRRDYLRLCRGMRILVGEYGWRETISLWKEVPVWSKAETHKWARNTRLSQEGVISVRRGKIRDGLLRVLGLESVAGIDIDLFRTFGRIKANEFESLREKAIPIALKHLKRQPWISQSRTFFGSRYSGMP